MVCSLPCLAPWVLAVLLVGSTALAGPGGTGPKATLQRLNGSVDRLLRKKVPPGSEEEKRIKNDVKQLAAELLDYGELTRRALGEHWDKMKPALRTDFVGTLRELIERNYVKQLRTNLDYDVLYGEEKIEGDEARVGSIVKVQTKGKISEAVIEYRMIRRDGKWMVYDVITDELSLVRNYRSQFQRIIAQQGYDGLLQRMKKKLQESQDSEG
ncbi:MAG: ABC transporter substrate-binding protein [Myxococcales bacterium]|nr:ABC transporter substrate-binding protein [Myxococcota bacterium]MDW8280800.1 ABC transporter substrate-binding protein [Myxococcales bacterium]